MLATLRQRNFALLWLGGMISFAGDWALFIALPVYVYDLTGSALVMGGMFIAQTLPLLDLGRRLAGDGPGLARARVVAQRQVDRLHQPQRLRHARRVGAGRRPRRARPEAARRGGKLLAGLERVGGTLPERGGGRQGEQQCTGGPAGREGKWRHLGQASGRNRH